MLKYVCSPLWCFKNTGMYTPISWLWNYCLVLCNLSVCEQTMVLTPKWMVMLKFRKINRHTAWRWKLGQYDQISNIDYIWMFTEMFSPCPQKTILNGQHIRTEYLHCDMKTTYIYKISKQDKFILFHAKYNSFWERTEEDANEIHYNRSMYI